MRYINEIMKWWRTCRIHLLVHDLQKVRKSWSPNRTPNLNTIGPAVSETGTENICTFTRAVAHTPNLRIDSSSWTLN